LDIAKFGLKTNRFNKKKEPTFERDLLDFVFVLNSTVFFAIARHLEKLAGFCSDKRIIGACRFFNITQLRPP
jgi:hypothetical protein